MDTVRRGPTGQQPQTLQEVALALEAGCPAELEAHALLFDEARRSLREVARSFDRALAEVDDAWWSPEAAGVRLAEPSRRTHELLHALDEAECGRQLRVVANALGSGQGRVRDLVAQGSAETGPPDPRDHQAQRVLQSLAETYQHVGLDLGGQSPPPPVTIEEPGIAAALAAAARDDPARVLLASAGAEADAVELFRPTAPTVGTSLPGDPVTPPASGAGGSGGGYPMMPFMPMGGMGGMGGGMGGMGGMQSENGGLRRSGALAQGDASVWRDSDSGWNVVGRREQAEQQVQEELRKEFRNATKGDRNG